MQLSEGRRLARRWESRRVVRDKARSGNGGSAVEPRQCSGRETGGRALAAKEGACSEVSTDGRNAVVEANRARGLGVHSRHG